MDFSSTNPGVYNCFQSVYAWYLRENNYDYYSVALQCLTFQYIKDDNLSIGNRIDIEYARGSLVNGDERLGIQFRRYDLKEEREYLNLSLEEGNVIFIWGDLYNCFWNSAYHKYHFRHCFLVYIQDGIYIAFDPFFGNSRVEIQYDELCTISQYYYMFDRKKLPSDSIYRILREIRFDALDYIEKDMSQNLLIFANDLCETDLWLECDQGKTDLYAVSLLDNLKIICQQRGAYAMLLDYMNYKLNLGWKDITQCLYDSKMLWEKLRMHLIKCIVKRQSICDGELVKKIINDIRDDERYVIKKILETDIE